MGIDVSGTPGKAAFAKFNELVVSETIDIRWEQVPPDYQAQWEEIAHAAILAHKTNTKGLSQRPDWWTPEHEQAALDGIRDQQKAKRESVLEISEHVCAEYCRLHD